VDLARYPDAQPRVGVVVVRPEGGLFYANAANVRHAVLALLDDSVRAVVLDAQSVPAIDVTAADMLTALQAELAARGVQLLIARDVGQVRDVLEHSAAADLSQDIHPTVRDAIATLDTEPDHGDT
jgi:sulfate permease, SulP family